MGLEPALELAIADFKRNNPEEMALKCGAVITGERLTIRYLNRDYSFFLPEIEWVGEVSLKEKIVILHYLSRGKGTDLSGREIDFRDLPGGKNYYSVFEARVCQPLWKRFGQNPPLLKEAALSLNGEEVERGDFAVRIQAFPKIPITLVLYQRTEEFPASAKVLFDSSISNYLTTEDIVVVCEDTVKALLKTKIKDLTI